MVLATVTATRMPGGGGLLGGSSLEPRATPRGAAHGGIGVGADHEVTIRGGRTDPVEHRGGAHQPLAVGHHPAVAVEIDAPPGQLLDDVTLLVVHLAEVGEVACGDEVEDRRHIGQGGRPYDQVRRQAEAIPGTVAATRPAANRDNPGHQSCLASGLPASGR